MLSWAVATDGMTVRGSPAQTMFTSTDGAELSVEFDLADPALFDANDPALQLAAGAFERACGTPPAFVRLGGTLPLLAVLAEQEVPTIVSGFALGADAFHAPNESYRLESLRLGELAARELYSSLADLPR